MVAYLYVVNALRTEVRKAVFGDGEMKEGSTDGHATCLKETQEEFEGLDAVTKAFWEGKR